MKAMRCHDLIATIGCNSHVGNGAIAPVYTDPQNTIAAVNYLGIRLLRDGAGDAGLFRLVCAATGAKMVMVIGESSPQAYRVELGSNLACVPYIAALEGPNEPDAAYAIGQGGSTKAAAAFQPALYAAARAIGVPAIANSFMIIWPDPGSYGTTGDLSAWADYGNAHTYFSPHQCGPNGNGFFNTGLIDWLQRDARLTVPGKPVAHTEFGWTVDRNTPATVAAYALTFWLSAHAQWNAPMSLYYGLFDDMSGKWGLFNDNGTPRAAATALRLMVQLLDDPRATAATFPPRDLAVTVSGLPAGENVNAGGHAALYQKANGDYWLALWNEQRLTTDDGATPPNQPISVPSVSVTITLPAAAMMDLFDPLVGPVPIRTITNAASMSLALPAHPVFVRIRA